MQILFLKERIFAIHKLIQEFACECDNSKFFKVGRKGVGVLDFWPQD